MKQKDYDLVIRLAQEGEAAYIITRNTTDFEESPVEAIKPDDFPNRF